MRVFRGFARRSLSSFGERADHELAVLQHGVESVLEDLDGSDVDCKDGVLTIVLPSRASYVINKQTPNEQLWWSSPLSGPRRYAQKDGDKWRCVRSGTEIRSDLASELAKLLPQGTRTVEFHD